MLFIDGCVENAKGQLGEPQSFALCKCILGQVKEKFSAADSVAIAQYLSDTTRIAGLMRNCK